MVVIIHFLLEHWKKRGKLNGNQFIATTIVSTPMLKKMSSEYNVVFKETLTGFKWISKRFQIDVNTMPNSISNIIKK